MEHFYNSVEGWFNFKDIYDSAVAEARDGAAFAEIGSWYGRSAAYMAVEIANSGKKIDFYCIDTWRGSDDLPWMEEPDPPAGSSSSTQRWRNSARQSAYSPKSSSSRKQTKDEGEQVLSGGVILSAQAQRTMGGIREDYVVGFAGPRPQGGRLRPMAYCSLLPTVTHDPRNECAYYCTPDAGIWVCDPPAVYRPRHPEASIFYQTFEQHFDSYVRL